MHFCLEWNWKIIEAIERNYRALWWGQLQIIHNRKNSKVVHSDRPRHSRRLRRVVKLFRAYSRIVWLYYSKVVPFHPPRPSIVSIQWPNQLPGRVECFLTLKLVLVHVDPRLRRMPLLRRLPKMPGARLDLCENIVRFIFFFAFILLLNYFSRIGLYFSLPKKANFLLFLQILQKKK